MKPSFQAPQRIHKTGKTAVAAAVGTGMVAVLLVHNFEILAAPVSLL